MLSFVLGPGGFPEAFPDAFPGRFPGSSPGLISCVLPLEFGRYLILVFVPWGFPPPRYLAPDFGPRTSPEAPWGTGATGPKLGLNYRFSNKGNGRPGHPGSKFEGCLKRPDSEASPRAAFEVPFTLNALNRLKTYPKWWGTKRPTMLNGF